MHCLTLIYHRDMTLILQNSVCQEVHQEFVLEIEMLLLLVWYRHRPWMDWNHPGSDLHHPGFFLKKER
jgi:hypothetical protein